MPDIPNPDIPDDKPPFLRSFLTPMTHEQAKASARHARTYAVICYVLAFITAAVTYDQGLWQIIAFVLGALALRFTIDMTAFREWARGYEVATVRMITGTTGGVIMHTHGPDEPCPLRDLPPEQ